MNDKELALESGQGKIREWLELGEAGLAANRPDEAASYFELVLKADPFCAKAHVGLSNAFWKKDKIEDALNCLSRALELEPNDSDTVLQCSRVFTMLGQMDYAKEVLEAFLERNPGDQAAHASLKALTVAVPETAAPGTAEFFREQGEAQFERGNIGHATACFEMAIEADPGMAEAYNNLGVIHWRSGKLAEALDYFYRALDLKPNDPEILGNSARVLDQVGQSDTAVEVFRQYLRCCPQDGQAWDEYESLVRKSAASQWNADGLSPAVAEIYIDGARRLVDAGDFNGAAEAVQRALQFEPRAPEALFVLALLHNAIGQTEDAAAVLDDLLKMDPSHAGGTEMLRTIRGGSIAA
ncbi:MAG: tetratricopeptide repeat protein [Desulfobacteraceae bacterium]|nr:tetratricopeptide repeat protein [Desulfobacteraceae bacterium]